jgi:hypothetical protein
VKKNSKIFEENYAKNKSNCSKPLGKRKLKLDYGGGRHA